MKRLLKTLAAVAAALSLISASPLLTAFTPIAVDENQGAESGPVPDPIPSPDPTPYPDPDPDPRPMPETLRILAIGNSFSQDAVEQYLWELFHEAGQKVIIGNLYIGGCTLETHYNNALSGDARYAYRKVVDGVKTEQANVSLLKGLTDEKWDIVSLQQASCSSGQYETYKPYLPYLVTFVKSNVANSSLRLAWHMTWSYAKTSDHAEFPNYDKDQMKMYQMIVSAVQNALRDNHFDYIIPSGTAIQNARTSYMGDSFNRDGNHLEVNYGRYTAACTWFEALSGKSVVGNTYKPASVDESQAAVAQNAAHMAVTKPYEVTDMVDFGGVSTAPSEAWNRVTTFSTNEPVYLKSSTGDWSPISNSALVIAKE